MAYTIPEMPLTCGIYTYGPDPFAVPPRLTSDCNLAWGRRVTSGTTSEPFASSSAICAYLLMPALTDVRGAVQSGGAGDFLEVPAGSGRYYFSLQVDDLGKGFANEHRFALISPLYWTPPYS